MSFPDEEQAWFWSDEWQAGEREATEDIETGRTKQFDNVDDLIQYLEDEKDERG